MFDINKPGEMEKAEVPAALYDFFAFGPDHKAGFVPIAFVDFGFYPSVGVYAVFEPRQYCSTSS